MKKCFGGRAVRIATVTLIYCVITAVFFWPVLRHLSSALIGPPENNLQDFWNLWYATHLTDIRHFFDTDMIRYPNRISLIYHSFTYPHTLVIWLLSTLTGASHPALTVMQNISILLTFPLSALGTYYLARHFSFSHTASCIGGFIFAFNPWHIGQALHHMGVCQTEFFPFFALCWLLTIEKKSYRWLAASIILYALAALCSWYNVFYMGFFIIFHAIYLRLRDDELPKGWRLTAPLMCVSGVAILLSPLIIPMVLQTTTKSYAAGANLYLADLTSFFIFPPRHFLYGQTCSIFESYVGNAWAATAYLGWINILICGWLLWQLRGRKNRMRAYFFSGIIVFSILALGNSLHILGHDYRFIPMPHFIFGMLPFLSNIRTPTRILVFTYMFLALTIAYAITLAESKYPRQIFIPGFLIVCTLMFLDYYPTIISLTPTSCPAPLRRLAADTSARYGILNLPMNYTEGNRSLYWQTCHHKPIVYSVISRVLQTTLSDRLNQKKLQQQHRQLINNKIKYIQFDTPRQLLLGYHATCGQPTKATTRFPARICRSLNTEYGDVTRYEKEYHVVLKTPDYTLLQVY